MSLGYKTISFEIWRETEFTQDDLNEEVLMDGLLIDIGAELKESSRNHPERHSSRELARPLGLKRQRGEILFPGPSESWSPEDGW